MCIDSWSEAIASCGEILSTFCFTGPQGDATGRHSEGFVGERRTSAEVPEEHVLFHFSAHHTGTAFSTQVFRDGSCVFKSYLVCGRLWSGRQKILHGPRQYLPHWFYSHSKGTSSGLVPLQLKSVSASSVCVWKISWNEYNFFFMKILMADVHNLQNNNKKKHQMHQVEVPSRKHGKMSKKGFATPTGIKCPWEVDPLDPGFVNF